MKKKVLLILFVGLVAGMKAQLNFTITNNSGTNVLTCSHTVINLTSSSSYTGSVSYIWFSPTQTLSGSSVGVTAPGTYTVNAIASNSTSSTQTLSIVMNTFAPISSVTPTFQNITCSLASAQTITASTSAMNVTHEFMSSFGGTVIANSSTAMYSPHAVGSFTHVLTDNTNGCKTTKTFTMASTSGLPTYLVVSPQNFTLGCTTKSVATINIVNATTTNPPGGPVSYTLLSPSSGTVSPSTLGPNSAYTVNVPGTYIVITKDNTSLCETRTPISIISNTMAPAVSVAVPTQTLDCNTPQALYQGSSSNTNVSFMWSFPGVPGVIAGSTITVTANSVITTTSLVANFTLTTTDNNNTCKSATIVPVYQNIFPPKALITSGPNSAVTCITSTIMLTNQSTTGIPLNTFPSNQPIVAILWQGPTPQIPATNTSTYAASTPGIYTMTAKDMNNGCSSATIITINDNRIYPVVNNPTSPADACLVGGTATLSPIVTGSSVSYTWIAPASAVVSGANTAVLTTNLLGTYTVIVTNTLNGCSTSDEMTVIDCGVGLNKNINSNYLISLFPNPGNGLFTISTDSFEKNLQLSVYNSLGMIIKKQEMNTQKNVINLSNESNGIYIVQISDGSKMVYTTKLVKE